MLRTPPWPAGSLFQLSRGPPALSSDLLWRPPDWLFSGSGSRSNPPGLSLALGAPPTGQGASRGVS